MSLTVQTRYAIDPATAKTLDTQGLRDHFHIGGWFQPDQIALVYSHYDRLILGSAVPVAGSLTLDKVAETGTDTILDRREMGILNIGEKASVTAGDTTYIIETGEILYLGRGTGAITFDAPGRFYILSAPAHHAYPSKLITKDMANKVELGSSDTANERTIYQFLHPDVYETCQLLMGYTKLEVGSVWNTMPCHTHDRRMEAYLYFDVSDQDRVFHFMGEPTETRHLVMASEEAVISPPWSVHCGSGTGAYSFCWGMAGDNVTFTDMDHVGMDEIR